MNPRGSSKLYTVLSYNFNDYEIIREPLEIDPLCDYVYVTDDPKYSKQTKVWRVVVDDSLKDLSAFDKCYRVRFNLFKYATTPVCIYIDGSVRINKSLRKLYNAFIDSNAAIGLNIHPSRDNVLDEYATWVKVRGYDVYQRDKCLCLMKVAGYDPTYKGLYQGTLRICKNTELNRHLDSFVYKTLVKLGSWGIIERLDQTIYSFILNKFFNPIPIFPVSTQVIQSDYCSWCVHGNDTVHPYIQDNDKELVYVQGKLVKPYRI